jgi:hypothetical protein
MTRQALLLLFVWFIMDNELSFKKVDMSKYSKNYDVPVDYVYKARVSRGWIIATRNITDIRYVSDEQVDIAKTILLR